MLPESQVLADCERSATCPEYCRCCGAACVRPPWDGKPSSSILAEMTKRFLQCSHYRKLCSQQPFADAFYIVLEQLGASADLFQIRKPKLIDVEIGRIC